MLTKNTDKLRALVQRHIAADQVVQGTYWDPSLARGCFIGCLNHSSNPRDAEQEYGLPIIIQRIAESIFEELPLAEARSFFAALPDAIECDGKDLSRVCWQFLAAELRALPPQSHEIQAVIDPVINGVEKLARGEGWSHAAAANAAFSANCAAANCAAVNCANCANCVAAVDCASYAAIAAADYATSANRSAAAGWAPVAAADCAAADYAAAIGGPSRFRARRRQRDTLLHLISAAPVCVEEVGG